MDRPSNAVFIDWFYQCKAWVGGRVPVFYTEQWMPENGSSQNHFMMGQADEWLFKSIAGIRQQKGTHGMRHLVIAPQLVGDIQWVKASTMAAGGIVRVDATRERITVEIPECCDAEIVKMNGERITVGSGKHTF